MNTARPPKRSASIPTGNRASDPSRTGTATSSAVWVAESENISRNRGAKALIIPQAMKQTAKESVPRIRGRVLGRILGWILDGCVGIVAIPSLPRSA